MSRFEKKISALKSKFLLIPVSQKAKNLWLKTTSRSNNKLITRWTTGYVIYYCGHRVNYLSLNVKYFVVRDNVIFL